MPVSWFVSQRAAGVLSTVLPQSSEAVHRALQQNLVATMHRLLKVCTHRQNDCIPLNSAFFFTPLQSSNIDVIKQIFSICHRCLI